MISISLDRVEVSSHDELLDHFPDAAYASPFRSTLPLLDHWRTPASTVEHLASALNCCISPPTSLSYEYQVPVLRGRGKPSCTDLMVISPEVAIAIEAKYTEPMYEGVTAWLKNAKSTNRQVVLDGWLGLISSTIGRALSREEVTAVPYQMIHRLASVCSVARSQKAMVYLVYGEGASHYQAHIEVLRRLIGDSKTLAVSLLAVALSPQPRQLELLARWNAGERDLARDIRASLKMGSLFSFGRIEPLRTETALPPA